MNSVQLVGRLTRDPEIRYTAGTQMAVATFSLAIDRPTKAGAEKQTDFPRVTVFGKQAENCEKFLAKGLLCSVNGRLQTGSYEKDGVTHYTTDVIAERVEFLEFKDKKSGSQTKESAAPAPQGNPAQQGYAQGSPAPAQQTMAQTNAAPQQQAGPNDDFQSVMTDEDF